MNNKQICVIYVLGGWKENKNELVQESYLERCKAAFLDYLSPFQYLNAQLIPVPQNSNDMIPKKNNYNEILAN